VRLIHPHSLADTLDAVEEAFFLGHPLAAGQRQQVARWIAGRQGLPGSYAGMFAPGSRDWDGVAVFTGETTATHAGVSHILGEESCRALIRLGNTGASVRKRLALATQGMLHRLQPSGVSSRSVRGMYCCGICSVAMWRHLTVGGLSESQRRLTAGMKELKAHRDGRGRWRRFPFWYTLLALSEIDLPGARTEMRYAAPHCERYLRRVRCNGKYTQRRGLVAERILEKC